MKDRTPLTIGCLHINATLYVLLGLFLLLRPRAGEPPEGYGHGLATVLSVFCLGLAVGVELLTLGLRKRKFWAWIVGILLCGLYVPSLFLPLGALGLWGLLAAGSRNAFQVGGSAAWASQQGGAQGRQPFSSDTTRT